MVDDAELEELRRRKMAEIQSQATQEQHAAAQRAELDAQKQMVLRAILEQDARERLSRIRLTRPDVAESVENQLILLAQQGRIRGKVTDDVLKQFIARLMPPSRDIKIERK